MRDHSGNALPLLWLPASSSRVRSPNKTSASGAFQYIENLPMRDDTTRHAGKVVHSLEDLPCQRVLALASQPTLLRL
jgi:hypothetical protein